MPTSYDVLYDATQDCTIEVNRSIVSTNDHEGVVVDITKQGSRISLHVVDSTGLVRKPQPGSVTLSSKPATKAMVAAAQKSYKKRLVRFCRLCWSFLIAFAVQFHFCRFLFTRNTFC